MRNGLQDDMFTPDVIADPYAYYGRLRDEDPVHWNEKYEVWVVTRHDDLVWLTRHHELFSSAVFKNDPRPAYPAIDESDLGLYEYVRNYQGDQFIQHDRPDHLEMRKVVHGYFTPKSLEEWRPFVKKAVKELLDAAEAKGRMDVMRDLATPLPVMVIAQMMGVPEPDRPYIRELAEKGARVILCSHFDRPKGQRVPEMVSAKLCRAPVRTFSTPSSSMTLKAMASTVSAAVSQRLRSDCRASRTTITATHPGHGPPAR